MKRELYKTYRFTFDRRMFNRGGYTEITAKTLLDAQVEFSKDLGVNLSKMKVKVVDTFYVIKPLPTLTDKEKLRMSAMKGWSSTSSRIFKGR